LAKSGKKLAGKGIDQGKIDSGACGIFYALFIATKTK